MVVTQDILMRILSAVVLLGLAVFVHEAGHFFMAKKKGVRVEKFSLGFGPKLLGFKKGGTEYLLSLIPLGGYVKMAGDDPGKSDGNPGEFFSTPPAGRIKIVLAGPAMNLVLAYILTAVVLAVGIKIPLFPNVVGAPGPELAGMGFSSGDEILMIGDHPTENWNDIVAAVNRIDNEIDSVPVKILRADQVLLIDNVPAPMLAGLDPLIAPELGDVVAGTPAYSAGLQAGDIVLEIGGRPIRSWSEMQSIVSGSPGENLLFKIRRGENTHLFEITPVDLLGDGNAIIGVSAATPDYTLEKFGFAAIPYAFTSNIRQIAMSYRMLWLIISRPAEYKQFIGGPVMVVQMAGDEAQKGFSDFLSFMAAINIMLAIVNLIPFPVLDGGHILFFFIEMARKKPIPLKIQDVTQRIGLAVLILLMVYLVAQDSLRHIDRSRVMRAGEENTLLEP